MFGAGRLSLIRSQPLQAINYYTKATEVQSQYRNLHHISSWEIAIARLVRAGILEPMPPPGPDRDLYRVVTEAGQ